MSYQMFRALLERYQEHERRIAGGEFRGKCTQVDTKTQKCRIEIGKDDDGNPVLSPWVTYKQTAGAMKFHNPPSVGQPMVVRSESGDIDQGMAEPFRWSKDNPTPSDDPGTHKMTFGDAVVTVTAGGIVISVGGTSINISAGGVTVTGPSLKHNAKEVGDTHKHKDVMPGGALTGDPA